MTTRQCFYDLSAAMIRLGTYSPTSFVVFWDYSAASVSVNRKWLWRVPEVNGCTFAIIRALRLYYESDCARIKLKGRYGSKFLVVCGARQGRPGSVLFWSVSLYVVCTCCNNMGPLPLNHNFKDCFYADVFATALYSLAELHRMDNMQSCAAYPSPQHETL
eukprot:367076-Amphidinium_carterae.3